MTQYVKNIAWGMALAVLTLPVAALAQWGKGIENARGAGTPSGTIFDIIKTTMNWMLGILGFLGIVGFVIAGILFLTATGDEDRIKTAKSAMLYSILGVIVALIGFVIIQAVNTWLGASSTSF